VLICTAVVAGLFFAEGSHVSGTFWAAAAVVVVWFLLFFRDPKRRADTEKLDDAVLYAPADGKVTEISEYQDDHLGRKAIKVGIFLSIFDVHLNRSPCACRVLSITRRKGRYLNAMNLRSSRENSCVELELEPLANDTSEGGVLPGRILVRQIAGVLARRIVCNADAGQELAAGERFGMIKFGSRTELIVPAGAGLKVLVRIGQKVHAGNDPLIEYR